MLGELTPEEIESMLQSNFVGRIGCNDGKMTYIVPVSYIYENNTVLCHSREGLKIRMMRTNPHVCFEVDEIRSYDHWRSVIAWGVYKELTADDDVEYVKSFFSDNLLKLKTEQNLQPPHTSRERRHDVVPTYVPTIFYRVHLHKITGRFERKL